jgi:hypothetical protein
MWLQLERLNLTSAQPGNLKACATTRKSKAENGFAPTRDSARVPHQRAFAFVLHRFEHDCLRSATARFWFPVVVF